MTEKILLVDDDAAVLEVHRRHLSTKVQVETALSGPDGLAMIESSGPFAVVISDLGMPGMNGAEFLEQVRNISPDSVRMILSGQGELGTAIAAVNLGHIFRFLTKPSKSADLFDALEAGLEQYGLIIARRELLEKTLHGTVQVLTEVLGLTNRLAQKRANRIARYAKEICKRLDIPMQWQLQIAVMLSQIGCIALPEEILAKVHAGQELSREARSIYRSHPAIAGMLLSGIPRLEPVAEIVSHQLDTVELLNQPEELKDWEVTKFGAMLLKVCADLDDLLSTGVPRDQAVTTLVKASPHLPETLLEVLHTMEVNPAKAERALVNVSQLRIGMILDQDVMSTNGLRLVPKGQEITRSIMLRLHSFAEGVGVIQPFQASFDG